MATKQAEKPIGTANDGENMPENMPTPITAVGYDANGEAIDVPVDTRVEPPLPGFEDDDDGTAEMFEGKRVIGHKWSFTGNHEVNFRNQALLDKLDLFRRGETTLLLVEVEPGDVTHALKGHPFDEVNTRLTRNGRGRVCRACARVVSQERKALAKAGLLPIKRHGTTTGYDYGCRCFHCRAAHATYRRNYLNRKAAA